MFPPFHDLPHSVHRADVFPTEERRVIRRSAPERLRFEPLHAGAPVVPLLPLSVEPAPARPKRGWGFGWFARIRRQPTLAPQM